MKNTSKLSRVLALVLCVAMLTLALASCGKDNTVAFTYTAENGETYTLSEADYKMLMTIIKQNLFSQYLYYGYYYGPEDNAAFWATKTDEGKTYEQLYTENAMEISKSILVEQFLMKKYGLTLDDLANYSGTTQAVDEKGEPKKDDKGNPVYITLKEEYENSITAIAETVKSLGGKGAYRRYYGYMPADLEKYYAYTYTSKLVLNKMYEENPLTDEQLDEYYTENFKQYLIILINLEEDIKYEKDSDGNLVKDENGNNKPYYVVYDKTGSTKYVTDISEEYLKEKEYTLAYSYQYEKITDTEQKEYKKELAADILAKLEAGGEGNSFEELAAKYSDEMLTHYYKDGYMVDGDLITDDAAIEAIKDLEVGEYTKKSFTIDNKYEYIIKRVDLTEKAWKQAEEDSEVKTYADLFKNYVDAVETEKYSDTLEEMAKAVIVDTAVTSKYTMQKTFLSRMFAK